MPCLWRICEHLNALRPVLASNSDRGRIPIRVKPEQQVRREYHLLETCLPCFLSLLFMCISRPTWGRRMGQPSSGHQRGRFKYLPRLLRQLGTGFPRRGFNPGWLRVRFVVNNVALEQGFSSFVGFPLPIIIPPFLHTLLSSLNDSTNQAACYDTLGIKSGASSLTRRSADYIVRKLVRFCHC
jgi:hypothetical protein